MNPHRYRLRPVLAMVLLVLACQGCASLKPSTSQVPPENDGGLKVSDNTRAGIGIVGDVLYFVGMFFHTE